MANAYVDLGTWWCVTPFIGAGVGGARVSIANFTDTGHRQQRRRLRLSSFAFGDNGRSGISPGRCTPVLPTRSAPNFTLELAYSYVNLGDGLTGRPTTFDRVTNTIFNSDRVQEHHLAGPEVRRALGSRQSRRSMRRRR